MSAIETGRLVPSVAVALAVARALGESVEAVFGPRVDGDAAAVTWVAKPRPEDGRFWQATVGPRLLRYPAEALPVGTMAHDGDIAAATKPPTALAVRGSEIARDTLVVAGCDPAVGLLAEALRGRSATRLLPLHRSSGQALDLLRRGLVHAAGIHLCGPSGKAMSDRAVRDELAGDGGFEVVHVAAWQEGVALGERVRSSALRAVLAADLRWIQREPGSGARQCLDTLFAETGRRPRGREHVASGHRAVAEVIRSGCADAGVTVRLAAEEAGLQFLSVRRAPYELWFRADMAEDPRLVELLAALRSRAFRATLGELPGYDSARTGELRRVA